MKGIQGVKNAAFSVKHGRRCWGHRPKHNDLRLGVGVNRENRTAGEGDLEVKGETDQSGGDLETSPVAPQGESELTTSKPQRKSEPMKKGPRNS